MSLDGLPDLRPGALLDLRDLPVLVPFEWPREPLSVADESTFDRWLEADDLRTLEEFAADGGSVFPSDRELKMRLGFSRTGNRGTR